MPWERTPGAAGKWRLLRSVAAGYFRCGYELPVIRRLFPFILLLFASLESAAIRVVHVIVALADNENQGIAKLPGAFGDGSSPAANLNWGAGRGMKSHFDWAPEWQRLEAKRPDLPHILDRAVWKHRDSTIYVIADAYDGRSLRQATEDLLLFASGGGVGFVSLGGKVIPSGGGADLIAFLGHNGLMDHKIEKIFLPQKDVPNEVIILAPISRGFFANHIRATGARPLLWTTGVLSSEAFTLREALIGWVARETDEQIRERAAKGYDLYMKSGIAGARRLLVTGW